MVAVHHVRADEGALEARAQRSGDEKIINAPADVPRARAGHRTPPGVMSPARLEFAEGVHESRAHERAEAVALLDGETVVADVGLGIREVNLGVRHVEVAAEDHGLFLLQLFQVAQKILVPNLTVWQPL